MWNSPAASLAFLGTTFWLTHLVLLCLSHVSAGADILIPVLLMNVLGAGCRQPLVLPAEATGAAHQSHQAASKDLWHFPLGFPSS